MWRKPNLLTVTTFRVMVFFRLAHYPISVALSIFDLDSFHYVIGGWLVEYGVFFKSQYSLYAVDCGRVAPRVLDAACGGRHALIHHHYLGSWSKKPHWLISPEKISKSMIIIIIITKHSDFFTDNITPFDKVVAQCRATLENLRTNPRYLARWLWSIFGAGF